MPKPVVEKEPYRHKEFKLLHVTVGHEETQAIELADADLPYKYTVSIYNTSSAGVAKELRKIADWLDPVEKVKK
jgi:hypothetical protein